MKGIILAGGKATRLYPVTKGVCKQMLAVYDKPMIYYPLSVMMLAGLREILIISTAKDLPRFKDLLGDGARLGIKISYAVQNRPQGIAESFIIGESFIGKDSAALVLGDNIFYGDSLTATLKKASTLKKGALAFGYYVKDPCRYGVLGFSGRKVVSIEEKPKKPKSNYAVCGLYFFDHRACQLAKTLQPSSRGELEITDLLKCYMGKKQLGVELLGRGYAWLDTGTHDALLDAALFIKTVEERQGLKIGCIEEVAYRMGFINKKQLLALASGSNMDYGKYLRRVCEDERQS